MWTSLFVHLFPWIGPSFILHHGRGVRSSRIGPFSIVDGDDLIERIGVRAAR